MLSATVLTNSPRHRARTTIRTIIIVISTLLVAMWAAVGFDVVSSRQSAVKEASAEGHNLMVAFREEVASAHFSRGGDGHDHRPRWAAPVDDG
jgi:hypothetical protein